MNRLPLLAILSLILGLVAYRARSSANLAAAPALGSERPPILMTDVTQASGIHFSHCHGGSGRHYYVETMTGGCAFLDADGDGWLDAFLVQGAPLPGYKASRPLWPALYHNNRDGTFTDVTRSSGLAVQIYGMGAAVGDTDNDGRPDLYLTALGGNHLFHNEGGGRFQDVTRSAGVAGKDLSTSAAWVDYDQDGRLDLFVCRYMDYALTKNPRCQDERGRSAYCSPHVYTGTHCLLYHNNGDGSFTDVTQKSGIGRATGRSLGVACADFDDDGRIDLYVANDLSPNFLFLNNGDGTFREEAATAGLSHGENGIAFAGMGVDCGDYRNDGRMGLLVTNFQNEPISLYRNNGDGTFDNESFSSGVGTPSLPYLKWGCHFADLDLDGFQDLFVANGHVDDHADERGNPLGYAQPCQVFRNEGNGIFSDVSLRSGRFFSQRQVARGAAFGDADNDGDIDVLIACNNQPAILLRNDSPRRSHWIRLALVGRGCNRDALGARVRVRAGGITQTQTVRSGTSYLADHDRRLLFGIGESRQANVEIRWPCGALQTLEAPAGATATIRESRCRIAGLRLHPSQAIHHGSQPGSLPRAPWS
jgi:hypothetical protein